MRKTINKTKLYIIKHKVVCVFVLLVLATIGYWGYKKFTSTAGEIRYVTAKVEKGAIVVSVSGSGQVSSLRYKSQGLWRCYLFGSERWAADRLWRTGSQA